MEPVCFSKTLVSTCKSTRRHHPEDQHRQYLDVLPEPHTVSGMTPWPVEKQRLSDLSSERDAVASGETAPV
jgi:hypothetical protein